MRRKEKEITDRKGIVEILASGKVCRLALTDGRWPYVVPDRRRKTEGSNVIMKQQSGREGWRYDEKLLEEVAVLKISIDSVNGKRSD